MKTQLKICFLGFALFFADTACHAETPANLLRNGSFELGLTRGDWGIVSGGVGPVLDRSWIDSSTAAHGIKSMRIPADNTLFTAPFTPDKRGEYLISLALKSDAETSVSVSVATDEFFPKSSTPRAVFGTETFKISTEWQTYETLMPLPDVKVFFRITAALGTGHIWIDSVSITLAKSHDKPSITVAGTPDIGFDITLEETPELTEYIPRSSLEAGLFNAFPGKIFHVENGVFFEGLLHNYSDTAQTVDFEYKIRDIHGDIVKKGESAGLSAPSGKTVEFPIVIDRHPNGLFSLTYWLKQYPENIGEEVYTVIPTPAQETILGACSHSSDQIMEILQRAGVRHFYALTDSWLRPENFCHNGPGNYRWFDDLAVLPSKYNVKTHGTLWHSRLKSEDGGGWDASDIVPIAPPVVGRNRYITEYDYIPSPVWREHVRAVATHYKPWITNWVIDDEVNHSASPGEYIRILRDARETLKKIDPALKLAGSAGVHWFEEMKDLGGLQDFDAIAGSIGGVGYWESRKTGWFADKHGKEVWISAMIKYGSSFYHTHIPDSDWRSRARSAYISLARCFFLQHSQFVTPYIFRLTAFSTTRGMPQSMLDYDGGLKSHGFGFVTAGVLFSLWERTETQPDLPDIQPDWTAFTFTYKDRPGTLLFGNNKHILLPLKMTDVDVFDWCGNPTEKGENMPDGIIFKKGHIPLYILGKASIKEQNFFEAVDHLKLIKAGRENTDFYSVNGSDLMKTTVQIDYDSEKTTVTGNEKTTFNPARPLEDRDGPWLLNVPWIDDITLDGNPEKWTWRSGGTMNVEWHGMAPVGRSQYHIVKGGEFVRYDSWNDIKARFYAGYDSNNLYFAAFVHDDDVAPREMADIGIYDAVEFHIDPDYPENIGNITPTKAPYVLRVKLENPEKAIATLIKGEERFPLECTAALHKRGYFLEVKVPTRLLGDSVAPAPMEIVGLDVIVSDADYDKDYAGEERFKQEHTVLRWAAGRPFGQMIFTDRMQQD